MYFDTPAPFLYVKEWHTDPLRITKDNLTFVILNYEVEIEICYVKLSSCMLKISGKLFMMQAYLFNS